MFLAINLYVEAPIFVNYVQYCISHKKFHLLRLLNVNTASEIMCSLDPQVLLHICFSVFPRFLFKDNEA